MALDGVGVMGLWGVVEGRVQDRLLGMRREVEVTEKSCRMWRTLSRRSLWGGEIEFSLRGNWLGEFCVYISTQEGLPWWLRRWSVCLQCRRPGFNPWVGKLSWRRKWQPTPVFLPGKSHGQRSLASYSLWDCKESGHNVATKQQIFHCNMYHISIPLLIYVASMTRLL